MSVRSGGVLGIALGTSTAGGYVTAGGHVTPWLNEIAFVPIDYRDDAPVDEWSGDRGCEQQAFPRLGDPTAAEERRQGKPEPNKASQERNVPKPLARCRHHALSQGPVDAGEGPKALADDHDAVRARHPSEPWQSRRGVRAVQHIDGGGPTHLAIVAKTPPPGKCRAAYLRSDPVLPVPAREEAEEREHEDHDEDDPEDAHAIPCLLVCSL